MSSESLGQSVARNTNWINSVISNSKLSSQLTELSSITSLEQKIVVQQGELDAKYANAKTIRGYKGNWNANTNNPTLFNNSGVVGDIYKVNVAGTRDIGSGSISYEVNDLIYLSESNWIKLSGESGGNSNTVNLTGNQLVDGRKSFEQHIIGRSDLTVFGRTIIGKENSSDISLVVKSAAGNTSDLQRWQYDETTKTVIDVDGNIGVGKTNPDSEIDVLGGIRTKMKTATGFSLVCLNSNSTNAAASGLYFNNNDSLLLLKDSSNDERVVLRTNGDSYIKGGRLGVGANLTTTRAGTKLYVANGDIQIENGSTTDLYGLILQTPDGLKRYRIRINNSGTLSTQQIT
jgi:hypothetical protein